MDKSKALAVLIVVILIAAGAWYMRAIAGWVALLVIFPAGLLALVLDQEVYAKPKEERRERERAERNLENARRRELRRLKREEDQSETQ